MKMFFSNPFKDSKPCLVIGEPIEMPPRSMEPLRVHSFVIKPLRKARKFPLLQYVMLMLGSKGKNNQAPGDFYRPVPPPERPVR